MSYPSVRRRTHCLGCPRGASRSGRQRSIYSRPQSRSFSSYFGQTQSSGSYYSPCVLDEPYKDDDNMLYKSCCKLTACSELDPGSIGNTVGLVCSNVKITPASPPEAQQSLDFAIYLKAFALIYVLPEIDWTAENIDMLMQDGAELFKTSSESDQSYTQLHHSPIYNKAELCVKRKFKVEGHTFTVELEPRYLGDARKPAEQQPPHIIRNLKVVLKAFFRTGHYCLLWTKSGYLLIWQRRKAFFVLDVKGRRRKDLVSTKCKNGVAMLVCLKAIDNVVYLVSNLSGISPGDGFTLRELVVVRLVTPDGCIFLRDSNTRSIEFEVINKNYAYLKSTLHLSLNPTQTLRNRSSLMVGVAAILAAKIDHPATWNTNTYDRLICYGVELCRSCWESCTNEHLPINLDTFPTQLRLGQFVVELRLLPNVSTGRWQCSYRYRDNDFERLLDATLQQHGNALFHINNQMYAIWCKNDFYYLLDPYRHTIVGTRTSDDSAPGAKWATVRMFRDLVTLLSVFHQLLIESNRHSTFYIHAVTIKNLAECPRGYALAPAAEDTCSEDVKSINETICFSEQYENCANLLSQVSDYEEDIISCSDDQMCDIDINMLNDIDREDEGMDDEQVAEEQMPKRVYFSTPGEHSRRSKRLQRLSGSGVNPPKNSINTTPKKPTLSQMDPGTKLDPGSKYKGATPKLTTQASKKAAPNITRPANMLPGKKTLVNSSPVTKPPVIKPPPNKPPQNKPPQNMLPLKKPIVFHLPVKKPPENKAPLNKPPANKPPTNKTQANKTPAIRSPACNARACSAEVSKPTHDKSTEPSSTKYAAPKTACTKTSAAKLLSAQQPTIKQPSKAADLKNDAAAHCSVHRYGRTCCKLPRAHLNYPGYSEYPHSLAIAGSESGTVESLNRLLHSAFQVTDRVLAMTPWGNYVVFKKSLDDAKPNKYFVFDGCTCNIDRFRHLDLRFGTSGLLPFQHKMDVVCHMIDSREVRAINMLRSSLGESRQHFEQFLGRGP